MKWILAALILSVGFMTGCQCSERPGQGTDEMDTPAEEQVMPMDETGDGMGGEPGMGEEQDSVPTTEDEPVDEPMEEAPMEEEPAE